MADHISRASTWVKENEYKKKGAEKRVKREMRQRWNKPPSTFSDAPDIIVSK
jgi:hypothetical protein